MTKNRNCFLIVFVLFIGLVATASQVQKKPEGAAAAQGTAQNDHTYVIGPEDVLNVNVWKEPDVSGAVPVRPDGKISLPLLNDVQAAGLTPMQLMSELTEKLKQFITDP